MDRKKGAAARSYEAVRREQAEIGLVSYPQASREVLVTPWLEERMVVAVGLQQAPIAPPGGIAQTNPSPPQSSLLVQE